MFKRTFIVVSFFALGGCSTLQGQGGASAGAWPNVDSCKLEKSVEQTFIDQSNLRYFGDRVNEQLFRSSNP